MSLEIIVTLIVIGVVLALCGVVWLHGHKSGVDSAIARATTIPGGVAQKIDAVVPGAAGAAQNAASQVGAAVTGAVEKVS